MSMVQGKFRELFDACNINYTDYIRTTEPRHKEAVAHFWNDLSKKGFLYKSQYSGWYSVNDECFLNDDEVMIILKFSNQSNQVKYKLIKPRRRKK
jgi:methionyl-tRNA synthetase